MRPSSSTCRSAIGAVVAACAVIAWAGSARAQPCCGGASAFAPARLTLHEDALVGVSARAAGVVRSFDARGAVVAPPRGTREVELEQDVVAALRVLTRGQVSLLVPLVETLRQVPGRSEASGGYGDVQLGARWDFTLAGQAGRWPGLAALAAVTLPTGVPPESARKPLATDATGAGATEVSLGAAVERAFGPVLVHATGTGAWRSPRDVGPLRVQPGLSLAALAGAGVYLPRESMVAISASYAVDLATREGGDPVADSQRSRTRLVLAGGLLLAGPWRAQASLFWDVPLAHFGQNRPAMIGGALLFVRGFS